MTPRYLVAIQIALVCLLLNSAFADILITKLDDISLSTANTGRDTVLTERFCVASDPVGPYGLIVLGSGENGTFTIQNGPFHIEYEVAYRDRVSGAGFIEVLPGMPVSGFQTRPLRNNQRCTGNAGRLRIIFRKNSINSAVSGRYQGSVQLTVIPE
ncbi:MAG: hypothetical protein AB8C40_06830 [Gammaproteobacteria bacterium]